MSFSGCFEVPTSAAVLGATIAGGAGAIVAPPEVVTAPDAAALGICSPGFGGG